MVRKTKEEAQETRDRILKAAADLFYEKGVSKTTLEDIAEAASLTRGAIYWHFKNKLDLFSALHEQMHGIFMGYVIALENVESDQPLQQLSNMCTKMLIEICDHEDHRKALNIFTLKCDYSGDMAPFLEIQNAKKTESLDVIHSLFRKAIELGHLRSSANEKVLAISMFCYICGIMTESLRSPNLVDIKTQSKALVDIYFQGIAK